ncbi:glycosyltransferase family 2 protein [Pseudoruegeria sp. HB172150]|uniref:glycosyltransferase family 2 protein n=1 Tax=Pseudoruegeria sp. HB172150 TaxID=2721164 RepID=UPI00155736B3|nr:glycosyltransferase family 2 protein [Pseudoruegeria sp. HB172150]
MTEIDIGICTYRRQSLNDTLRSLAALEVPDGVRLQILVADNDIDPSARDRVSAFAKTAPWPVHYLHRPHGNISIARNGILEASTARYLAFIDDDETAAPGWIAALLSEHQESAAEVVLGPVEPVYSQNAPAWMQESGIHETQPVWVGDRIVTGYTCNVLIDRGRPRIRALRFHLALGQTGGEDTMYFSSAHKAGAEFAFAEAATIFEPVPEGRANLKWLATRRYRMGQTHARTERSTGQRGYLPLLGSAAAKLTYCAGSYLLALPNERRRNAAYLRGCLHAGVVSALLGGSNVRLYGSDAADLADISVR